MESTTLIVKNPQHSRSRAAWVENGISYVATPRSFGLIRDFVFLNTLLYTTPREILHVVQHAGEALAHFVQAAQRLGPLKFQVLYPLGGVAASPLGARLHWERDELRALCAALKTARGWHFARFCALNADELTMLLAGLREQGLKTRQFRYPSYVIHGAGSFDSYLAERTKSFRSSMKASMRKAQAQGFQYRNTVELNEWKSLYERRTGSLSGFDYSVTPGFHSLMENLIQSYRKEGRLIEAGLGNDDNLIAAGLGLLHLDTLYFYQTAHDPAFHALRPGVLVFLQMIKKALERGVTTIAFISDAPYLRLFTDQAVCLHELEVFSTNPLANALYLYREFRKSRPTH